MAIRIPVREEKGRLQALPGARVQAATAGTDALAAVGRGIQDAGRPVVEAIAAEEQRQRTNVLMGKKAELMDLDRGHRESLRKVKGKDVAEQRVKIEEAYDRDSKVIIADTGNQAVRDQVQRFSERHTQSFKNSVSGHVAKETERAAELDYQAVQVGAARDGAEAYAGDDLQAYDMAKENALASTVVRADQQGLGEKPTEEAIADTMTRFHSAVLSNLLAEEEEFKAEEYYKKNKDEMSLDDRKRLGGFIEASSRKRRARLEEEAMWAKADGDPIKFAELALKVADIRSREHILEFNKIRQRVTNNARVEVDKPIIDTLRWNYINELKNPRNSPELFDKLSDGGKAAIMGWYGAEQERRRARARSAKARQADDWPKYLARYNALDITGNRGNDQATIDIDNSDIFHGSNEIHRDKILAMQKRHLRNLEKGLTQTYSSMVTSARRRAMGDPDIGKKKVDRYLGHVSESWDDWMDETNTGEPGDPVKNPSKSDVSAMFAKAERMMFNDIPFWRDTKKMAFDIDADELSEFAPVVADVTAVVDAFIDPDEPAHQEVLIVPRESAPEGEVPMLWSLERPIPHTHRIAGGPE